MKIFNSLQLNKPAAAASCRNCAHFENNPAVIEKTYPGLTVMSSGYASVRDKDGLCNYNQLYLSAWDSCPGFTLRKA
jgi:hypothetical protein